MYRDAYALPGATMSSVCQRALHAVQLADGLVVPGRGQDMRRAQALGINLGDGRAVVTIAPFASDNEIASMLEPAENVAGALARAREEIERVRPAGSQVHVGFGPWWTTDNAEHVPLWCAPAWWLEDLWGWLEDQMRRPAPPVGDEPPLPWPAVWTHAITREIDRRRAEPGFVLW